MFDNIGKKIKTLTKVLVWVGIITSVIAGVVFFIIAEDVPEEEYGTYIGLGFAYLIGGPLLSWVSGFFMYGFGELVDNTCDIRAAICGSNMDKTDFIQRQRREKLDKLLHQGLITQEEYNKAVGQM